MRKKTMITLIGIVTIVVMTIGGYFLYKYIRVKNVFDEVYYSEAELIKKGKETKPSLANIDKIDRRPWGSFDYVHGGRTLDGMFEVYNETTLKENIYLSIYFTKAEGKSMSIVYGRYITEEIDLGIYYEYDVESKILQEKVGIYDRELDEGRYKEGEEIYPYLEKYGISIEEIKEMAHEGLYEIFLPDWFEGNQGYSRFSMDNLGSLTIEKDEFLK